MNKVIITIVLLAFFCTCLTSCKKEGNVNHAETPMQTTIAQQLVVDSSDVRINPFCEELGQKLYFSKNGYINKLGCKLANTGQYTVCFWDYNTTNIIASTIVDVTDSTKFFYNSVSPIAITANKRYILSVNNNSSGIARKYFVYSKKSNLVSSIYPFTTGSVTYETNEEGINCISAFPTSSTTPPSITGTADLEFEPAE